MISFQIQSVGRNGNLNEVGRAQIYADHARIKMLTKRGEYAFRYRVRVRKSRLAVYEAGQRGTWRLLFALDGFTEELIRQIFEQMRVAGLRRTNSQRAQRRCADQEGRD